MTNRPRTCFKKAFTPRKPWGTWILPSRFSARWPHRPRLIKVLAAQAQYQLVVCMLQKGDRAAARKELDLLARNFSDQPDLATKARKLVPDGDTLLPAPWGEFEGSQLDIKRDGVFTGEYLHYSVDPTFSRPGQPANPQAVVLRWELTAKNSNRWAQVDV